MAEHGITIRWSSSRCIINVYDGIRTRIEAVDPCNMSEKIFAYRMLPLSPQTGSQVGAFSHICSPVDLEEFPADEPIPGQQPGWFRRSYVDILLRSADETANFIAIVREDVRRLKVTLDEMDTIILGGEEVIGTPCPDVTNDSSSAGSLPPGSSEDAGPILSLTAVGTFSQTTGTGTEWTNVGLGAGSPIGVSDSDSDNYAQVILGNGLYSRMLLTQGFEFCELPDNAQIVGLAVRLGLRRVQSITDESSSLSDVPCPHIVELALDHPDHGLSENKATGQCVEGPAWYDILEGGNDDLWGDVWSAIDIKRGEFGLGFVVGSPMDLEGAVVEVDGVEITVYYRI